MLQPYFRIDDARTFNAEQFTKGEFGEQVRLHVVQCADQVHLVLEETYGRQIGVLSFSGPGAAYLAGLVYMKAVDASNVPPPGGAT